MAEKHIVELTNHEKVCLEEIKCPICGESMSMKKMYESGVDACSTEIFGRSTSKPIWGLVVEQKTTYETTMQCPRECCELSFKHQIVELIK